MLKSSEGLFFHFLLITFRFAYGRTLKPLISDFGIFGRVPEPPNQSYLSFETTESSK